MDWIFDHFQILALVGLALASWLKSRSDAKAAEREEQEARRQLEEPDESWGSPYQEPMLPSPPPLVRVTPPPLPAVEMEGELRRQKEMQERLREIRETRAVTTGGAAETRARGGNSKPAAPVPAGLRSALRNHGEVRRAIVLREILGPPLGLR